MKKIIAILILAFTFGMLLSSCKLFKGNKKPCPAYRGAIEVIHVSNELKA